jgi:MscS family membrane protein
VELAKSGSVWLFSSKTLDAIPGLYEHVALSGVDAVLPHFLIDRRVGGVRLFEWLAVLLGLPALYLGIALLNRAVTPLVHLVWRRQFNEADLPGRTALPAPARLLILALAARWLLFSLQSSLLIRQFWGNIASLIAICSVVWLLMLLNAQIERYIRRRLSPSSVAAAVSLLRLGRRGSTCWSFSQACSPFFATSASTLRLRWPGSASEASPLPSPRRRRSRT